MIADERLALELVTSSVARLSNLGGVAHDEEDGDSLAATELAETLHRSRPGDARMCEETGFARGLSGRTWILDPLDGSTNWHRGTYQWGCSVALLSGGRLTLGAIAIPDSVGTWAMSGDVRSQRRWAAPPARRRFLVATGQPHLPTQPVWDRTHALLSGVTIRVDGSCVHSFAQLILGHVDLYFEGGLQLWDFLGGAAVAIAAGHDVLVLKEDGRWWCLAGDVSSDVGSSILSKMPLVPISSSLLL